MKSGRVLVLIGGLLTAVSALLIRINTAYVDGDFENFRYVESIYGKLAIVTGLVLLGVALALFLRPNDSQLLGGIAAVVALIALAIAVVAILDTSEFDKYEKIAAEAPVPGPSRAGAPFVAAFGSLLALAGGLLTRRAGRDLGGSAADREFA